MYRIERISERDLGEWINMMLELWDENTYEALKAEHIELINDSKNGNFICYDEDEAVGFINMSLRRDYVEGSNSSPVGYVEGVYVKPGHRRTGIARKLVDCGIQWAKELGCSQIGSDCVIDNVMSCHFHKGLGFEEAERIVCFIKDV